MSPRYFVELTSGLIAVVLTGAFFAFSVNALQNRSNNAADVRRSFGGTLVPFVVVPAIALLIAVTGNAALPRADIATMPFIAFIRAVLIGGIATGIGFGVGSVLFPAWFTMNTRLMLYRRFGHIPAGSARFVAINTAIGCTLGILIGVVGTLISFSSSRSDSFSPTTVATICLIWMTFSALPSFRRENR